MTHRRARTWSLTKLSRKEVARRKKLRVLPNSHPSGGGKPMRVNREDVRQINATLNKFEVVEPIEYGMRLANPTKNPKRKKRTGPRPRFGARAILVCTHLAAENNATYKCTDVTAVAVGLHPQDAVWLGLQPAEILLDPVSYDAIRKQLARFEQLLDEGFTYNGKTYDRDWFTTVMLAAAIPDDALIDVTAVAVDSTAFATWFETREYIKEKDAQAQRRAKALKQKDPLAEHRLKALEEHDLEEPDLAAALPKDAEIGTKVGEFGPDGRLVRSVDPEARPGYKSSTGKERARLFLGYDVHIAVAVKGATFLGVDKGVSFSEPVLPFILGLHVSPGATNPAIAGIAVVLMARALASRIDEVLADRAYTTKGERFNRPLHQMGIDVVMDYPSDVVKRTKTVKLSRTESAIMHCGTLLHKLTPKPMRRPGESHSEAERTEWYEERALSCRYIPNQYYGNGGVQFRCPFHAGHIATHDTIRVAREDALLVTAPKGHNGTCCNGTAKTSVDLLDQYQRIPYGTKAWRTSYGRRNQVENVNKELRDQGGLDDKSCRKAGLTAHWLAALFLAVVHNMRLGRMLAEDQTSAQEADAATGDPAETEQAQDIPTAPTLHTCPEAPAHRHRAPP
ncbi:transposase [Candidatus Poriferisodalis sp.]|uniref:transposase n=1 Tax=Candidatus Poriferisodalis sp. TaxID=3101277 RepID=UPI003B028B5A